MAGLIDYVAKASFVFLISFSYSLGADAFPSQQYERLVETETLNYSQHEEKDNDYILTKRFPPTFFNHVNIDKEDHIKQESLNYILNNDQTWVRTTDEHENNHSIESIKENHIKKLKDLSKLIYPGLHHDNVKTMQESLQYFGYYKGELDGIYGPRTKEAIEMAENEFDMPLIHHVENTSPTRNDSEYVVKKINEQSVIHVAKSLAGTPYIWGGDSPRGFDCSGFVQYVYETQGMDLPRTVKEQWNFLDSVQSVSAGDLVFFETSQPGPSHLGIYLGDGKFIHAGSSRGVEVSELTNPYWEKRYLGAKRINE